MAITTPIGRFAPSPTHHLHLGSLTTAVASFCHIKSLGGQWLLRIEDIDLQRCKPQYADSILNDLDKLGLHWDGEVIYQSNRLDIYQAYLDEQLKSLSYACHCSRKQLDAHRASNPVPQSLNSPIIYPRLCLHAQHDWQHADSKIRLQLPDVETAFVDGIQGIVWDNPAKSLGDVVVKRQNGLFNYVLVCAIDDGLQGITHLMRGIDIMPMTVAQLHIIKVCRLSLPSYIYHLPLIYNTDGQKLSKQNLATPIDTTQPAQLLYQALTLLGQPTDSDMPNASPKEILDFAVKHWDNTPLLGRTHLAYGQ